MPHISRLNSLMALYSYRNYFSDSVVPSVVDSEIGLLMFDIFRGRQSLIQQANTDQQHRSLGLAKETSRSCKNYCYDNTTLRVVHGVTL